MATLHGIEISPFVRKVRIAAAEKGIAYDHEPVVHFALPEGFEALHPLRKIPVWTTDEGQHIPDSSVILAYLERTHPSPRLVPEEPGAMAEALFLEEFADSAVAMSVAAVFLEIFAAPRFFDRPTDDAKVKRELEKLEPLFAHLDGVLGSREFFVGDAFSLADVAVASPLIAFRHTGHEISADLHPNLRRYADAIVERPTIAAIFAEEVAKYGGNSPEAQASSSD